MLEDVGGTTLLGRVLSRLSKAKNLTKIVVATSVDGSDDEIYNYCKTNGISCLRGSLLDVADRYMKAIVTENVPTFVRISGDSPVIDPVLVDYAVDLFNNGDFDLVTNVFPRTYPKGQSVEIVSTEIFIKSYSQFKDISHFEHVTKYFYDYAGEFKIKNFESAIDYGNVNLCIDTPKDLSNMTNILNSQNNQPADWKSLADTYLSLNPSKQS